MEARTTVSTAELCPLVSALKNEMQKKGYSPLSMRGWKMSGMRCYATHPLSLSHHLTRNSGKDFYKRNMVSVWILNTRCTEPAVRLNS